MAKEFFTEVLDFSPEGRGKFAEFITRHAPGASPTTYRGECLALLEDALNDSGIAVCEMSINGEPCCLELDAAEDLILDDHEIEDVEVRV